MTRVRLVRLSLCGAIAVALAVAGCGGGSGSTAVGASADTLIANATSTLDEQHTFRFDSENTAYNPGQPPNSGRETGVIDLTAQAADIRFPGQSADQGAQHVIIVNGKQYVSPPLGPSTAGKRWTVLPASPSGRPALAGFPNPLEWLAAFQRLQDAKVVGTEKVRGVETTHLTATMKNKVRPGFPSPAESSVEIWFDQQNRIRELHIVDNDRKNPGFEFRYWFYDFGVSVHVTAPPASQVAVVPTMPSGGIINVTPSPGG